MQVMFSPPKNKSLLRNLHNLEHKPIGGYFFFLILFFRYMHVFVREMCMML